jgi:hypothetical protein
MAHPTRFERVIFAFGGQRSATPARWQAAAAQQRLVAKLSCKGVTIFYQDGRGKTFSTSLEVGRNKSWAETTCYKVIPVHLFHSELSVLHRVALILGRRMSH